MLSDMLKWGGKRPEQPDAARPAAQTARRDEPVVPSKAFPKFLSALTSQDSPVLLDFGPVIGPNVGFFGERLGCKLFIEDILTEFERHQKAGTTATLATAFESRFRHADGSVDGVLCWDIFDFLDRPSATALAHALTRLLRPEGALLAFFSSPEGRPQVYTKFIVVDDGKLRHRTYPASRTRQKALQNRDIIKMFEGLRVAESFLMKNNVRELLFRKPGYLSGQ